MDGLGQRKEKKANRVLLSGVAAAYFVVSALVAIFQIVEIVQFARKKLSPVLMVVLNSISTIFWAVIFIIGIVGAARVGSGFGLIWPLV